MPVANSPQLASFEIKVNNSLLPIDTELRLVAVSVEEDVNLPSMFTLEFAGLPEQQGTIAILDDARFAIGSAVEVKLGYVGQLTTLLKGEITALEPAFVCNGPPSLIVRGYDRRHRLQRGRKTRTFVQQKDSDIATQIASEAGLTAQTKDSKVVHDYLIQANQTDWEFLQSRARLIQYEVMVEDKTLNFRPVSNDASTALSLSLETNLLEFHPRLTSTGQVSDVIVQGWNPKDKAAIVGKATAGEEVSDMGGTNSGAVLSRQAFGKAIGRISDQPVITQAEADQIAKAQLNRSVLTLIQGEAICRGQTDVRAGKVVTIAGIGNRFSGQYYITTASHRYGPSGYYTSITVRRNAS